MFRVSGTFESTATVQWAPEAECALSDSKKAAEATLLAHPPLFVTTDAPEFVVKTSGN